jgi:hypothetical protein
MANILGLSIKEQPMESKPLGLDMELEGRSRFFGPPVVAPVETRHRSVCTSERGVTKDLLRRSNLGVFHLVTLGDAVVGISIFGPLFFPTSPK